MSKRWFVLLPLFIAFTSLVVVDANAAPVLNPENGHYYEAISSGITWTSAKYAAQSSLYAGEYGHLVTITSSEESTFITSSLGGSALNNHWIGGFQPSGSPEPDGGWQWVTGEAWNFSNWHEGEPNNTYGGEHGIHPKGWAENAIEYFGDSTGLWNDFPSDISRPGYIVEYDTSAILLSLPGGTNLPDDPDTDGLYDDVNGNGRADFADVVLYFNQMSWIAANEPVTLFDYNANGRIDFADVVWLFNSL